MSSMFRSPKFPDIQQPPPPVVPPPPPAPDTKEEEKIREEEKKKIRKGREKRSTILTSERGILTPAQVNLKTLLGE